MRGFITSYFSWLSNDFGLYTQVQHGEDMNHHTSGASKVTVLYSKATMSRLPSKKKKEVLQRKDA